MNDTNKAPNAEKSGETADKRKRPDDPVDEASEESFPASDPPSHFPTPPCRDGEEE